MTIAAEDLCAHAGFLRDLAHRLLVDAHGADDVVQQTYLAALSRRRAPRNPRSWLGAVARNLARRALRAGSRRTRIERAVARPEGTEATDEIAAQVEVQRELAAAVCRLAEPYRSAIVHRFYDNHSPREIARRLAVPVETVKTRIKRGIAQLRATMDGVHGGDDAWRRALLPLVASDWTLGAAATTGAALVSTKTKLALVFLPLLGLVAGVVSHAALGDPAAAPAPVAPPGGTAVATTDLEESLEAARDRITQLETELGLLGPVRSPVQVPAADPGSVPSTPEQLEDLRAFVAWLNEERPSEFRNVDLESLQWTRYFALFGLDLLDGRGLELLARVPHLDSVNLSGSRFTHEGLAPLAAKDLKSVIAHHATLDDASLELLARSGALKSLDAIETSVTSAGLTHLSSLRSLRRLNLAGSLVDRLESLPVSIEELVLARTPVGDGALATLGRMTNLRELNLASTPVTDAGLEGMSVLLQRGTLRRLDLSQTRISDQGLLWLMAFDLRGLRELNLSGTAIRDPNLVLALRNRYPGMRVIHQ